MSDKAYRKGCSSAETHGESLRGTQRAILSSGGARGYFALAARPAPCLKLSPMILLRNCFGENGAFNSSVRRMPPSTPQPLLIPYTGRQSTARYITEHTCPCCGTSPIVRISYHAQWSAANATLGAINPLPRHTSIL